MKDTAAASGYITVSAKSQSCDIDELGHVSYSRDGGEGLRGRVAGAWKFLASDNSSLAVALHILMYGTILLMFIAYSYRLIYDIMYLEYDDNDEDCLVPVSGYFGILTKAVKYYNPFNTDSFVRRRNEHMFLAAIGAY